MQPMLLTGFYVFTIALAFLMGVLSVRGDTPIHHKVFVCLLGVTLLLELYVYVVISIINKSQGNSWLLYNPFILPEFLVYAFFFYKVLRPGFERKVTRIFFIVYPIVWLLSTIYYGGFESTNIYSILFGSIYVAFASIGYYYQLLKSEKLVKISRDTAFWIVTGLLIFYPCQIPFFGLFRFILKNYRSYIFPLRDVMQCADALMYLLFTYAFFNQWRTRK
jgi:hypothetical protein